MRRYMAAKRRLQTLINLGKAVFVVLRLVCELSEAATRYAEVSDLAHHQARNQALS